jgi:predicted  nucleic acid-binding Zn-ribbon protein
MDEKIEEILKHVNRRLMNAESSVRVVEQRIDVVESTIKAIERKIGRNTQDLFELSSDKEEVRRLRDAVIKLSAEIEGLASESDVDALRKYLDLVASTSRD